VLSNKRKINKQESESKRKVTLLINTVYVQQSVTNADRIISQYNRPFLNASYCVSVPKPSDPISKGFRL